MRSASMRDRPLRDLIALSLLAVLMFGAKFALQSVPNVHLGAVLLIMATLRFGPKALCMAFVYVMLEGLSFGFGYWWFAYLYIWPILVLAVLPQRKHKSWLLLSLTGAVHGYLFGAMCAIVTMILSGIHAGFAFWIAGIPYDLIHGTSNFILCLALLRPLDKLAQKL